MNNRFMGTRNLSPYKVTSTKKAILSSGRRQSINSASPFRSPKAIKPATGTTSDIDGPESAYNSKKVMISTG
jgi:hypothetical protein